MFHEINDLVVVDRPKIRIFGALGVIGRIQTERDPSAEIMENPNQTLPKSELGEVVNCTGLSQLCFFMF